MQKKRSIQYGQSLLEVLIAMAAAVIVITAITTAVVTSLRNAQTSRNQNQAAQYAQEGMEYMRQARNQYYAEFESIVDSGVPTRCLAKNAVTQTPINALATTSCPTPNIDTTFIRTITFSVNPGNCNVPVGFTRDAVLITVNVKWAEGRCGNTNTYCAESKLVSCFTPYNTLPAL